MKLRLTLVFIAAIALLTSCKKSDVQNNNNPPPPPPPSASDKLKDTVGLYARDIYLWYAQIPTSFNPRLYDNPNKIMEAIRQYSHETGFTQPVDRWSFAATKADWDNVSSGVTEDFGMNVFFNGADLDLRVRFVEKASPAGQAGIRRGWRVRKINGNSNMSIANADFIVDNVYYSTATSFTFEKPDGSTVDVNLNAASYQEHPIFLDSVYTSGSKKIGYMVFNSFLGDTTEIYNQFQSIFGRFTQENIDDVVVDLRYNGGGFVSVTETLGDYLVNSSADGQIMMMQKFNDKYGQFDESSEFHKKGTLNLPRVFFIVGAGTASASELLINNLKPYMEVILVGEDNTYGKPVGYFPIPVGDWYIFPVSFRTTNKNGVGNYFNGFAPNFVLPDGLDKDWGDITENSLASVFRYITTGAFKTTQTPYIPDERVRKGNRKLDEPSFKGAIGGKREVSLQ